MVYLREPCTVTPSLSNGSADRSLSWYVRIIKELGFPIIVAVVLLYVILADVPENVASTRADVRIIRDELAAHSRLSEVSASKISAEVQASNDRLARIMQQICVNTAQNNTDRLGCFPLSER
jgi:hypothetical protein